MQATVEASDLRRAVTAVKGAIARSGAPAVKSVRLEARDNRLHVSAYDFEIRIGCEIPAVVAEDGVTTAMFTPLNGQVKGKGAVQLQSHATGVLVRRDLADFNIAGVDEYNHASLPDLTPLEIGVALDPVAAAWVASAAGHDSGRPILTGVNVEHDAMAGTDSYRLHVAHVALPVPVDDPVLVPARAIGEAGKMGNPVYLAVGARADDRTRRLISVSGPVARLATREIDGHYPNWRQLMSCGPFEFTPDDMPRFRDLLESMTKFAVKTVKPIRFDLTASSAHVTISDAFDETMTADVPCTWTGADFTVAYNPRYLRDMYTVPNPGALHILDGLKPALLDGSSGDVALQGLIMPVRVV